MTGTPNGSAPDGFWTDWLYYMGEAVGLDDPRYVYWANLVGHSYQTLPTDATTFCLAGPYTYPDMSQASFATYGPTYIFVSWMQDYLFNLWCTETVEGS